MTTSAIAGNPSVSAGSTPVAVPAKTHSSHSGSEKARRVLAISALVLGLLAVVTGLTAAAMAVPHIIVPILVTAILVSIPVLLFTKAAQNLSACFKK